MSVALSYVMMAQDGAAAPAAAVTPTQIEKEEETKTEVKEDNNKKDEEEIEGESKESHEEKLAHLKKEAEERLAKKEATQRTLVCIEVKPWDTEQDLMELWKKITTTITQDGLVWGENCKLVPVAFGIKKIQCTFTMGMSNSSDAVVEAIEALEDEVQSVEVTSMNML
mmetsp:Transcript_13278/g.18272  ORF Transcript_13278/g.18272 Transcript_13278/m.18272 type:complete len:168 (-) Transcript_13278:972-1475(-)